MGYSLVAFDTDHIKQYVFGTDKLKEIRGASSLLDYLNRIVMVELAENCDAKTIYAHGGSGLFLIDTSNVSAFKEQVQRAYLEYTGGGASVTAVDIPLPGLQDITEINTPIPDDLAFLQWRLQEEKARSSPFFAQLSHPFMRLCDACGIRYVDAAQPVKRSDNDLDEVNERYCSVCRLKRIRDSEAKDFISMFEAGRGGDYHDPLWHKIIGRLKEIEYKIPPLTERPIDFNVFRNFKGSKDYLALVYADANNILK